MTVPPLLSLRDISVRFGSVTALDRVDLTVDAGEVRAVLGENGAGKSTLMNVVYGLLSPDQGSMQWNGAATSLRGPQEAHALGIGMVHQEFALVDALSVAENLAEAVDERGWLVDYDGVFEQAEARAAELGLALAPAEARVGDLPVGARQRIEILKAMLTEVRLLILDEPTAVLTPAETEQLFAVLRGLRDRGVAILLITHKLREVIELADTVTVLRRGRVVAQRSARDSSERDLAELMVGSLSPDQARAEPAPAGPVPVLRARRLACAAESGAPALDDASAEVGAGEILGIAGVDGNGQQPLFEIVSGLRAPTSGSLEIDGTTCSVFSPGAMLDAGVSIIAPDRRRQGAVLEMRVWENAILDTALLRAHSSAASLDRDGATAFASDLIDRYSIVCDGPDATAASLSGGNLQKLIVARALATAPRLLVAFNPTRGLDIGAARAVHTALRAVAEQGGGVLLLSTDLDEVLGLSHRVAVLSRGRLSAPVAPPYDRRQIGLLMGGGDRPEAA